MVKCDALQLASCILLLTQRWVTPNVIRCCRRQQEVAVGTLWSEHVRLILTVLNN
ncbi:hypothetical protein CA11_26670 [Gimesia maris]|nr:hypothetical protein CA11_26670 [Gimesia maris]